MNGSSVKSVLFGAFEENPIIAAIPPMSEPKPIRAASGHSILVPNKRADTNRANIVPMMAIRIANESNGTFPITNIVLCVHGGVYPFLSKDSSSSATARQRSLFPFSLSTIVRVYGLLFL